MPSLFVSKPRVEVAGSPIPPEVDGLIEQIVVDDSRLLPDMFRLQFRDPERTVLSKAGLTIGAKVKIFAGSTGEDPATLLISGEVTALEAEIDETGTHVIARGYDSAHRLQRGRKTRTFVDVTEADIVTRVVNEAGMKVGDLQGPSTTYKLVSQANQSDLEFLRARAREVGCDLVVDDDTVALHPPIASATAPATGTLQTEDPLALVMGNNLDSFLPRITAGEQVETIEVRGWDPDTQTAVSATAPAKTTSVTLADGGPTPATTASAFGSGSRFTVVDRPLRSQEQAQHVADSVAEQLGSAFAEAEGVATGDPRLCAGAAVSVAGVGQPFEGQYTITSARHVIGASGYRTHFTVSGRQERSLLGLASGGDTAGDPSAGGAPIFGVVIGIVTNNSDDEKHGRVKLKFPWLDDKYETDWARVVAPGAGANRGIAFVPEVNDEVLVAFEQGDVRSPFVIGGLWSAANDVPQIGSLLGSGSVDERVVQGRIGHRLVISDKDGDDGISLTTDDGEHLISIKQSGEIEITTSGTITLKGQTIELKGTSISISADASLELKGATVSISGDGPTTIKGTPLALN